MHFLHKHICIATTLGGIILFNACAPESKYNGGNGALRSYESMDAYGNNTIKYRQDYTQPTQSSFSSTLVANDRDNIRQTPQNNRATQQHTTSKKGTKSTQTNQANTHYEPPVKGDGSFTPTQSLLGGMRDSEAIQRATMRPYTVRGKTYRPHPVKVGDTFDGIASWYGPDFHAKATSNGETYNMHAHTAAHKTFPMNTIVKVYNKDNGKTTVVRINDRGPFVEGRIIDLSNVAAHDIAMVGKGIANVRVEVVGFGGDLVHNTPPKDSKPQATPKQTNQKPNTQQQVKHTESSPQPPKEQYTAPQQQNTILKPRQNTQVTHTESIPQEPTTHAKSTSTNQTNNTTQTHNNTQSTDTYTMPTQDSKTQSINLQNTPQTESSNTNQTSNVANSPKVENKEIDSTPFEISEEELPEFEDTTQSKTKEAKHETKPQPTKDETLDSAFVGITPKHIDNTESIKDIDDAMQRLKDSTENLAKKAQNEIKNQAKENTQQTAIDSKTDSKVENTESKQPSHTDSKQIDSNNTATSDINKGNFMISLNVFSDENRAKSFKDDNQSIVKDTNYSIDIVPTDKGYRVALRGFKTYDEAKAFIAKYDIKGYVAQESK